MLTGADLDKLLSDKIDQIYTGYIPVVQRARLFKDVLHSEFDRLCKDADSQMMFDKIGNYIKTEYPVLVSAKNRILLKGNTIKSIATVSTNKWAITLDKEFDIVNDGSLFTIAISGASGTLDIPTGLNGSFSLTPADKISSFVVSVTSHASHGGNTNTGVYVANSGVLYSKKVYSIKTIIEDYKHLRTINVCSKINTGVTAGSVVSLNPFVINISGNSDPSPIRDSDYIIFNPTEANPTGQTVYIKPLTINTLGFYTNSELTVPFDNTAGHVTFTGNFYVTRCKYATPYVSDRKISSFGRPSIYNPKFETSENYLKLYNGGGNITQVYIDYAIQPVEIDLTSATTDYSVYYNQTFLYSLVDCSALEVSRMIRDGELNQYISQEIKDNP